METKFENKPYWHIHHETLLEWNTEPIENRIAYIKVSKSPEEIPTRLRLLKPVQGLNQLQTDPQDGYTGKVCTCTIPPQYLREVIPL